MNPALRARWNELAPLLDRALELPPEARARHVAALDVDAALRVLLHELLDAAEAPGILDGDSGRYAQTLLRDEPPATMPQAIGAYRILRLLGEGGSGSVFLAEREADGYVQRVALKLLRIGVRDPVEQERFRRERRILARLEHPHIARLLDGGFTPDGVPWFALEYIDGEPLTAWCDARTLDLAARLRLFDDVCAAVSHAHHALVVHRDLKPANILVDAEGRPHLLDFGIARLLDPTIGGDATQTGMRRMTPAYAAPEQFDAGTITTATDVFALGVLLHELLTGLRPKRDGDADIRLPSAVFAADTRCDTLAAARATTSNALARALRGDLDTVLSTALAHAPQRRYASVEAFVDDLRRYRDQRPILARRSALAYRAAKFLRRNRSAAALAALLAISLVAGIAATLRESHNARAAAARATHEAERAAAVKEFVLALFAGVTPDESRGRAIGARELLERSESRLAETLTAQPQLEAELSTVLAGAWRQLGSHERAATLARRAVEVATDPAARHAAALELGAVLAAQGLYDEAERMLRNALDGAPDAIAAGTARVRLAEVLADRGHPEQALALLDDARTLKHEDPQLALRNVAARGSARFRAGDLAGADHALRDALEQARTLHGERHTETARREHDLAVVLLQRGATADAAGLLERAIATRVALLGERHPDVAQSRFNLAVARQRLGQADVARALFRSALAMQRELLGERHPDVAGSLNSLANLDFQQGDFDAAIRGLREALVVARAAYGDAHPTVATMLGNLAGIERFAGRIDEAARDQREALALTEAALGERHYLAGVARLGLAGVLIEQGHESDALGEQRHALRILEAGLGTGHADVLQARAALADSLLRAGLGDEARATLPADGGEGATPTLDPRQARVRLVRLRLLAASGDCAMVVTAVPDVVAALARAGGSLRADQASAELLLARCLRQRGATSDAPAATARADALLEAMPYVPRRVREDRAAIVGS